MSGAATLVLRNAHVIDPAQGINRVTDVAVVDGRIATLGEAPPESHGIDLAGHYLTPGWIDIHVHVYGALGFADPDSIGILQGVTSFIEAGGAGIATLDEFAALLDGQTTTRLYVGPLFQSLGLIGMSFKEGDPRAIGDISIPRWLEFLEAHPGLVRYLKFSGHSYSNSGQLKMAKGLAEILGLPLYMHVGEFLNTKPEKPLAFECFRIAEAGDIITHIYHGNLGHILDREGMVLPEVREAERRGVLFDVGFGGFNFSWRIAERAYAQGLVPHIISSDLQQFNVTGPVFSLAHVMAAFLRLGLSLGDVVERVTAAPARALAMSDRAGSLKPGLPADITVFRLEQGEIELPDTSRQMRKGDTRIVPVMAFRDGVQVDCDMTRCQAEKNWFMQIAEDEVPRAAAALSGAQRDFLQILASTLSRIDWELTSHQLDVDKAVELQNAFHAVRRERGLALAEALRALYACFLDMPFMSQIGLFLIRLERPFALRRIAEVAAQRPLAA